MQFQLPQFIDVEDKIFGPLTFKQFIYLAGGGGAVFMIYNTFPFFVAMLFIIPIVALAVALAFYKVNNKPFVYMMESAIRYFSKGKLYVWKKRTKKAPQKQKVKESEINLETIAPKLSANKLKDIAWSLEVKNEQYGVPTTDAPITDDVSSSENV